MPLTCPECGLPLSVSGVIGSCDNMHIYKLEAAEYPCEEDEEDEE